MPKFMPKNMLIVLQRINIKHFMFLLVALILSQQGLARGLPDFADLAEKQLPAVVIISTVQKVGGPSMAGKHLGRMPEYFRYFFGDDFQMPEQKKEAVGSGIIVSKDGYILTNHHVVAGADEVTIRLHDRRVLDAKVIGGDELSDLALLKVDANDLTVVEIGNSDKLRVGEWVMAIGTPFGFEHSVTTGIVSAKGRTLSSDNYVPFIQTDVAINPGNSGGPLFNLEGELVGVNSQIYSRSGGFMGLSFAIPSNVVMAVVEQLKRDGSVARGWLGVVIQDVDRNLARSLGLDIPAGAIVARVLVDGPADQGGIAIEDVVVKFNGHDIVDAAALRNYVGATPPGKTVKMVVFRGGKEKTLKVKLGQLPTDPSQVSSKANNSSEILLGMVVIDLSEEQKETLNIKGGVMIRQVESEEAKDAGIRAGDVIINLANQEVLDTKTFRHIIEKLPKGKWVPILINRRGAPEFLAIEVQ